MSQPLYIRRNRPIRPMPLAFLNTRFGRRCDDETYCSVCCFSGKTTTPVVQPHTSISDAFGEKPPVRSESAVVVTQLRPRRGSIAKLPSLRTRRQISQSKRRAGRNFAPPNAREVEKYSKRALPPTPTTTGSSVREYTGGPDPRIFNNLLPPTPTDIPSVSEYFGTGTASSTQDFCTVDGKHSSEHSLDSEYGGEHQGDANLAEEVGKESRVHVEVVAAVSRGLSAGR